MIPKKAILLTLGALTGCVSDPGSQTINPSTGDTIDKTPAAARSVDENLARLRALDVFNVGDLIVTMPEEATNCYGPCPGSEPLIEKAEAEAAARLDELTSAAEAAADLTPPSESCDTAVIDANIAALQALEIVAVDGLIEEQPKNNPLCYNVPCGQDIAAAQAITCARAGKLANIAAEAKDL